MNFLHGLCKDPIKSIMTNHCKTINGYIKGLTKLYIHVHVLIDIFMFTAANARWHFETKRRIQVHVLMKIAGGVQYMICDGTNSEHIVLAQSQYASPNYNIHSSKCWDFHLAFTYPWYSRPKCSNNQSFSLSRQYCEFSVIAIGEIK